MRRSSRDIVLVLVGIVANETLGHWWLGTFGKELLPMKFGPWNITTDVNVGFMIAWPIALAVLVWYAWFRKERLPAL